MTYQSPVNPFADPTIPTMADLLEIVLRHEGLELRQRREMASAIRVLEAWFARPLAAMPASADFLRRCFDGFHHEHAGVTRKRLQNVRSLLMKALMLAGRPATLSSYQAPLSLPWQTLHDRLPNSYARTELTRFMRFCSTRNIAPHEVDDAVSAAFLEALVTESLVKNPNIRHQSMCRLWNRMAGCVEGWPAVTLGVPRYRETYGLPWEAFPPSLAEDAERYLSRLSKVDLLAEDGPERALKPRSIATRRTQLRLAASALVQTGLAAEMLASLADLANPQRVRQILTFFLERNNNQRSSHIAGIGRALLGVARHHVRLEPDDRAEVERLANRVQVGCQGMSERNRRQLRQFESRKAQRRLLRLAPTTLERLARQDRGSHREAVLAAKAVALLILAFAPMRVSNLAGLHLERHLRWQKPKRRGDLHIAIGEGEVKNRQELHYIVPAKAAALVRLYLDRFRPRLLRNASNGYLFPGRGDRAKRDDTMSRQLRDWVWQEVGLEFHPHLIRHLAAKIMAERRPGAYEAIRRLLGHKRSDTTYKFYEGEETLSAVRLYDRMVLGIMGLESEDNDDA